MYIQSILDNRLRVEARDYDVFVVGSVQNPGMEEARSVLNIPVVGYGEHLGCCLGGHFCVIAFQPGFDHLLDLRIRNRVLPNAFCRAS